MLVSISGSIIGFLFLTAESDENGIDKTASNCYLVKNEDVVMDTHLAYPENLGAKVDGNFLVVTPEKTARMTIATVLYPRKADGKAVEVKVQSFKDNVLAVAVKTAVKQILVQLDLTNQQVTLR